MYWAHRGDQVPGRWEGAKEDGNGLFVSGEFADTSLGRDTRTLVKMGAVTGLSIGWRPVDFHKDVEYDEKSGTRRILRAMVAEVSIVPLPMNADATVTAVKSMVSPRYLERAARDAGWSSREAKSLVSEFLDRDGRDDETRRDGSADDTQLIKRLAAFSDEIAAATVYEKVNSLGAKIA